MRSIDLHDVIDVRPAIVPQVVTNDTPLVSAIIDRKGFAALEFALATGHLADTTGTTFTVLVEDGDELALGDAAAVADGDLLGTEAAASFRGGDDDQALKIGYRGNKRYVRMTLTPASNSGAAVSALAILGGPDLAPV